MKRHLPNVKTTTLVGLVTCLTLGGATAEARRGDGFGDIMADRGHSRRGNDSPDVRVDAASFFTACPIVHVTRETFVTGHATVAGDCTVTVSSGRSLHLPDVDLVVLGDLTIQGDGAVGVSIGDETCPDGKICAGSRIDAATIRIDVTGRDSRARVFFSEISAGAIDVTAGGADSEVRAHNSNLDAEAYILLLATGTDARMRVDVVTEGVDRNGLAAHTVLIGSEGDGSETRVDDTDFKAQRITIASVGETRAERNAFGDASVTLFGGDDCRSRNNLPPDVSCH